MLSRIPDNNSKMWVKKVTEMLSIVREMRLLTCTLVLQVNECSLGGLAVQSINTPTIGQESTMYNPHRLSRYRFILLSK